MRRNFSGTPGDCALTRKQLCAASIAKVRFRLADIVSMSDTPEERAREAARNLSKAVNEMSFDVESFADEILCMHRTLQQTAFGAFLACIKAWSELPSRRFDMRNAFTVKKSREIVELLGKYNLRVPFI